MTDGPDDLPPLIFQAALAASPMLFIGIVAWILDLAFALFDVDAVWPVATAALVVPVVLYVFTGACARSSIIRPDASPLALAICLPLAAAFGLWLLPHLPDHWGPTTRIGGRDGGSQKGFVLAAIVVAGGWLALRLFSSGATGPKPDAPSPPPTV